MYARLGFKDGWISWDTSVINNQFIAAGASNDGTVQARLELATKLLEGVFHSVPGNTSPAEHAEEQQRVSTAVKAIVPWLHRSYLGDTDLFEFAIHCAIAHHRLPTNERQAREARIASIVDGLLADAPEWSVQCGHGWTPHKTLGILLPDVFLGTHLRAMAARLVMASCAVSEAGKARHPMSSLLKVLPMPAPKGRPSEGKFFEIMSNLYINRTPADRPAVLGLINKVKQNRQVDWVIRANEMLVAAGAANVNAVILGDALINILAETLKDEQTGKQAVGFHLDQLVEQQKAKTQQVVQLTIDAARAGVPLGATFTANILRALDAEQQANEAARKASDAGLVRAHHAAQLAPGHAVVAPADLDPVHAWSVERLVAWIEGPVTRRPIQRQQIIERERRQGAERAAAAAGVRSQQAPAKVVAPEPELADEDINLAVDDALRSTAAFFRDDLNDMLALAKQLNVEPPRIQQAMQQREIMARLAAGEDIGDEQAQAMLGAAEAVVAQLRATIQRSQTSLRQRMGFTQMLNTAVQNEALVPGKRQGGVVACPMPLSSWPWVFDTFHGRWLHQRRRLVINNIAVPLREDQALALYVTGSSQSGHAFDVSVHLWQRTPGSTSLPSVDTDSGLRMNTDDWFDTYTTCAVLHVPLGK